MRQGKINQTDIDNRNWLTSHDVGDMVMVTGHHTGDFQGTVKYGGQNLAIIVDSNGLEREICYMHPVKFHKL